MKTFAYEKQPAPRVNTIDSFAASVSKPAVAIQKKGGPEEELPAQGKFTTQLKGGPEEELPAQGKFTTQLKGGPEEELPAQGKFTTQLKGGPEEELPAQGKFTTQLKGGPEEELPAQGKFTTQLKGGPEEELPAQGKFTTQLKGGPEEELPAQGKFNTQLKSGPEEELPAQGKFNTIQRKENKTGLPDNLKSGIENLSGYSMDNVKVHYNSSKPAQLNALAYAQGTDIHVGAGQEQHLPHEAWHVVQQMQGRVQPTMQMKQGVPVNDDKSLEQEADAMGAKAIQMKANNTAYTQRGTAFGNTVQRVLGRTDPDLLHYFFGDKATGAKNLKLMGPEAAGREIERFLNATKKPNIKFADITGYYEVDAEEPTKVVVDTVKENALRIINAKYNAVNAKYGKHIFEGEFAVSGKPSGYHSKAETSSTHEAYGSKTAISNGVYQQSVRQIGKPSNKKLNQSTFFPDTATREQIIKGIASVEEAGLSSINYVHENVNGISLTKRGDTIYPAGGSDSLTAE